MAKQYNPWTGFLEETSVKTSDGLDAPEKNAGYEMKKEGQYFKVYKNGKLISVSSTEEQARREAARHRANSQDEKPTIDKAIRNCDSNVKLVKTVAKKNGYAIHIVSGEYGERIVLTFPGENYNNPHMWLGSNTSSNMSKAQELLSVFGK